MIKKKLQYQYSIWLYFAVSNLLCIALYFIVLAQYHFPSIVSQTLFHFLDAQDYKNAGDWLIHDSNTDSITRRPFLYPLLIELGLWFNNPYGLWTIQFLLWLATLNLIALSVKQLTQNSYLVLISFLIAGTNFSLQLLTLHALTEVLITFLISLYVYYISLNYKQLHILKTYLILIFIISLCTVVKPLYSILLYLLVLVLFSYRGYRIEFVRKPKYITFLLVALLPVLIQLCLVYQKQHTFSISKIGELTFKNYFVSLNYAQIKHQTLDEAMPIVWKMSTKEITIFLMENKVKCVKSYLYITFLNLNSESQVSDIPQKHSLLSSIILKINYLYFFFHCIGLLPLVYLLVRTMKIKAKEFFLLLLLVFPLVLIIFISGISFYQGDRLVLPSLPLWLVLYLFVFQTIKKQTLT